jgi:hypothetical protein
VSGTVPRGANGRLDEAWFGEAPSRILVACAEAEAAEVKRRCAAATPSVDCVELGRAGGDALRLARDSVISLDEAREQYERALDSLS